MGKWLFTACILTLSQPLCALDQAAVPVIRMGIADDFPPFYFSNEDGDYAGASYEIVVKLCESLGYKVQTTQFSSMKELMLQVGQGTVDVVPNLSATESRRKVAQFTTVPHIYETQDLIIRRDSHIDYSGRLFQLSQYRVGTIWGWTYGDYFDSADYIRRQNVNSSEEQLIGLLAGDFDVAINNREFILSLSKTLGFSKAFKVLNPSVVHLPVTIAVSKMFASADSLTQQLDREVKQFRQTEAYRDILVRYGFDPKTAELQGGQ
ncbi:substrate-binding periplasmic protein [Shewanella acanthi]|uniref:substrate-binding periplasmic protein n=1 Tax=Shewanella acanthi TaxID=2864212 RepID=UPI001C65E859|nr:transporter substrate-binding domain-containing protein [Shewanella acanthi]QYJ80149.1 transporter substrate-binding domain-containing protein [Shewanella acanthi]